LLNTSSSYVERAITQNKDLPIISSKTLQLIGDLDKAVQGLSLRLDNLIAEKTKNPSKFSKKKDDEVKALKAILEDFTERKIQLAVRNYDLIDHHIRLIDHELLIVENVMKTNGLSIQLNIPTPIASSSLTVKAGNSEKKRGRGRPPLSTVKTDLPKFDEAEEILEIDPNEPVYCICRQVAFGDMIACDNDACTVEWFHYQCVNLTKKPKSTWLCNQCKNR
jgi:hypothetical protein